MVLWGGLRPIASRVILDSVTLLAWIYCTLVRVDMENKDAAAQRPWRSYAWILASCLVTIVSAGNLTNRWTLTLPMVPFIVLQGMRRLLPRHKSWLRYLHVLVTLLSLCCILLGAMLCVLFPAVELPPIEGPYNVGKVDLFLPMDAATTAASATEIGTTGSTSAVWVRLLYPTMDTPQARKYLTPSTAVEYCHHSMRFGAPPPLKDFGWMLHTWRLAGRLEAEGASLAETPEPLPTIVYSHGLGGHADIYSFQTHSLAAHGNVVLVISHADGTSPAISLPDGTMREYDYTPQDLERTQGYIPRVIELRRNQTELRVQELVAATQALQRWNEQDVQADLPSSTTTSTLNALSLKGRLDLEKLAWAGHSFGGATVLTAAHRHPELVSTVVAHEPALDWAHPSAVASLFAKQRVDNLTLASTYNEKMYGEPSEDESLHHSADTLLLFSQEWVNKKWAHTPLLQEMQEHNRLGSEKTTFTYDFIPHAHHNEFSDTSMITPLWLAREVGLTGSRNPIDTAREAAERTRSFLQASRQKGNVS